LRELATSLLPFIEADLPNTAYTLNTGRSPFEHRLAVIAGNGSDAATRLRRFLDTGTAGGVLTGIVPEGVDAMPAPANEANPVRLAELFVQGAVIDWAAWDRGYKRHKLALPTYPFQRRRHWYRDETPPAEDNLVYQVEWQPCSLPSLPDPTALAAALTTPCACTQSNGALDSLEQLSAHYAARALESVTAAEVAPNRRRLFDHLTATRTTSNPQPATYPEATVEHQLLTRCGAKLPAILTGACDPLSLLFPESGGGLDRIYRDSPSSHSANRLAREAMERILAGWPPERPLRILEVGAGTGGTTAHLLEILPPDRTEYVFTDVSRAFLKNARERFTAAPFVRYQALDIEKDPEPQGFPNHAYDVVVAANVLHATADLRTTLRHVHQLLAPGGLLLLLEVTRPQLWLDLTFGLLDGWWRFTDTDLRHGHPLLSPTQWQDLLAASAFSECASIPAGSDTSLLRQDLIIARAASQHLIWRAPSDNPETACQDLLAVAQKADRPIWAALPDNGQAAPAAISALGRVIGLEHPTIWGGLVHVPPQAGEAEIAACIDRAAAANEKEIAFRDGQTLTPRLVRKSLPASAVQYRFRPDATYLITGGFGFLGLRLARWMASQGARNLVLVGRSGASSPEATKTLAALRAEQGLQIEAVSADAAQPGAIASVIASIADTMPPLRGVVHAAGRGGMEPVATLTATQLHDEFAPKNTAALALHEATLSLPLDFFVLFSSASSIWGARGQAHYAAANACLDALAAARRHQNLPALSVNWGLLSGGGMISPEYRAWLTRAGVEPLEPENGFVSLFRLVTQPVSQAVIARVDWKKFAEVYEARQRTGLFDRMDRREPATPHQPAVSWQDMPAGERRTALLAFVQQQFCETLDLPPSEAPDPRHGFFDAGMDSLLAIEFKNRLQTGTGLTLPSTVAFNHPNCEALAAWLDHQIAPPQVVEPAIPAEEPASADAAEIARLFAGMQSFLQEEHQ
jgi:SAM-dependent methyltransferase/NADP-dependent 3-hydroxy acid dehydrogenase YdfG